MRIAIAVMPWFDVHSAPLGAGLLKAYLAPRGFECDVLPLNLLMAERVGGISAILSDNSQMVSPEWYFGRHLFGPDGLGELAGTAADAFADPKFREFMRRTNLSPERLEAVSTRDVPAFLDDCMTRVDWTRYDAVGFSSIMASHTASLALARRIKLRWPEKIVIFGGSNVEGEMGPATLEACEWIDYVVSGEGEKPLLELLTNLRDGRLGAPVAGVSRRAGGKVESLPAGPPIAMDELPTPDHSDYFKVLRSSPVNEWISPLITFESSRGCWWGAKQHCTFCGLNGAVLTSRVRSTKLVLDDIRLLARRHGVLDFLATDNILAIEHLRGLLPELARIRREEGVDYSFFYNFKSNLAEADLRLAAEAGIDRFEPGIESTDSKVLKLMRKGVRGIHNVQTIKFATEQGMTAYWGYIFGFPGEDPAAYAPMAELALALTHLAPPFGAIALRPDRFSPYHESPQEFGIEKPRPYRLYSHIYPSPRFDLSRVAFFHDFAPRPGDDAPAKYAAGLLASVEHWRAFGEAIFFAYRRGRDFVELFDSRPLKAGASAELRQTRLEGFEALAFGATRSFAPFSRIEAEARAAGLWPGADEARRRLAALTDGRILMREDDLYLALAVPVASLQPKKKLALENLLLVRKVWFRDRARARVEEPDPAAP
jgi:ribosomal peptide maturation radical SAM protein 1